MFTDQTFGLICNATGNERTMSWRKQGGQLGNWRPQVDETNPTDPDKTRYGQDEVLQSTLPWLQPGPEATCDNVDRHDGTYVCTATATAGGDTESDEQQITLEVQCKYTLYTLYYIGNVCTATAGGDTESDEQLVTLEVQCSIHYTIYVMSVLVLL